MPRLLIAIWLAVTLPAAAEERTFSVTIDGRPAGEFVVNYQARTDGSLAITVRADWRADRPAPISFEYRGTETLKDCRLVRLEGVGAKDGKKGGITLIAGKDAFALKAGVKEVSIRDEVWPTTGVAPPDLSGKPQVVDVITGDVLRARFEKAGADRIMVDGKPIPATRYRVIAGSSRWDVWYDEKQRLAKWALRQDGWSAAADLTRLKGD